MLSLHSCLQYALDLCSISFLTGPRDYVIVVSVEGHIVLFVMNRVEVVELLRKIVSKERKVHAILI